MSGPDPEDCAGHNLGFHFLAFEGKDEDVKAGYFAVDGDWLADERWKGALAKGMNSIIENVQSWAQNMT
jgi:hypothetical protein